ncbi:related to DNA-directed RNA polymerase III subunit RPC3 [Saccharomycodes ludwigii]|uniref:DNA-directed RNA polymerase III subunit RPC3 n=1 Tax=Saccharomycodes ludwigii TaxID=36035 RepID=A0A376B4I5_9ASCO|nr:hypothetical protein SCDLUD_000013 [Saccharomycodes ludwigii]KAH3902436.1 hypothetical protein SCDLUD_000013 [Saccharomycodes ludwigii]SSD59489.1 related to DNA-directed RNA polymerase III subunit RPC3 [Saccharomycodes ludwigii]
MSVIDNIIGNTMSEIEGSKDSGISNLPNDPSNTTDNNSGSNNTELFVSTNCINNVELRTLNPEAFLYSELIRSFLGEKASEVIKCLILKGRLTFRELSDRLNIDLKSIKETLVSLVQLRCVSYMDSDGAGSNIKKNGNTNKFYYSYNEEGLLILLYSGDIITNLTNYYYENDDDNDEKQLMSEILHNVLSFGSLRPRDFVANNHNVSESMLQSLFVRLVEDKFFINCTPLLYIPKIDLWNRLYSREYNSIPKNSALSDLKKRQQSKDKAKDKYLQLINQPSSVNENQNIIVVDTKTSLRKINDDISLTFNLPRYWKFKRSQHIVQFAAVRAGYLPSVILETALKITEKASPDVKSPLLYTELVQELNELEGITDDLKLHEENQPGVLFNAIDISKHLSKSIDLRGSIVTKLTSRQLRTANNGTADNTDNDAEQPSKKRLKTEDGFVVPPLPASVKPSNDKNNLENENYEDEHDDDYDDYIDDDDQEPHSVPIINAHLKLLANGSVEFIKEAKPGMYYVPYSSLIPCLKTYTYDTLIQATLGSSAFRVLRCIRENRLVTEKLLNNLALMREKDIRSVLSSLARYNGVEIQELPRTADRSASRSVFLFRTNNSRAFNFMKSNLCWNIANLIYRLENLKNENSTLLTKAQREDVKGKEMELLLTSEINQLKMVQERQLNSITRIDRLLSLWEIFKQL